eukprot:1192559-Rhodomonas_salina.1
MMIESSRLGDGDRIIHWQPDLPGTRGSRTGPPGAGMPGGYKNRYRALPGWTGTRVLIGTATTHYNCTTMYWDSEGQ